MLGLLTPDEIELLLNSEMVARLGCHADGHTYVVPVTYAYDGESLLIQSPDGMKIRMMHRNPLVCVEVDRIDNLANWRSVIATGRFEALAGDEAISAFIRLRERLQPHVASETTPAAVAPHHDDPRVRGGNGHGSIYRIRLLEKSGRFERSES